MQRSYPRAIRVAAASAAVATAALVTATPAQADPTSDAFISALSGAGVGSTDPATAVALGQSVCPMLAEPGQTTADVAGKVADTAGMPFGSATMFTGIAISMFCPTAVSSIGNGIVTPGSLPPIPFL